MKHTLACNLKRCDIWVRALYMGVAAVCFAIARIIMLLIALLQWVLVLFTREVNLPLRDFSQSLSTYLYQISRFLTFNTERRPFPFSDWPEGAPVEEDEPEEEICQHCSCQQSTSANDSSTATTQAPAAEVAAESTNDTQAVDADIVTDASTADKSAGKEEKPASTECTESSASSPEPDDTSTAKNEKDKPAS